MHPGIWTGQKEHYRLLWFIKMKHTLIILSGIEWYITTKNTKNTKNEI